MKRYKITDAQTSAVAEVCAAAARAKWALMGGAGHPFDWLLMSFRERTDFTATVRQYLNGAVPEQLHAFRVAAMRREGWIYGYALNRAMKRDPRMVDYERLPASDRDIDVLVQRIALSMADALALPSEEIEQ